MPEHKVLCDCEAIANSYAILNFQYYYFDSLIPPKVMWYNEGFEESEEVELIIKCTGLEIYPSRKKVGYYELKKINLNYILAYINIHCNAQAKNLDKRIQQLNSQLPIDRRELKVDTVEIEK